MFLIRDENGEVFNQVENPAAVFDAESGTLLRIGEHDTMLQVFDTLNTKYRQAGLVDMADHIMMIDLPRDQTEIDRVFQICDYVKTLAKQMLQKGEGSDDKKITDETPVQFRP